MIQKLEAVLWFFLGSDGSLERIWINLRECTIVENIRCQSGTDHTSF
jgi:hypothetical protein